MSSEDKKKEAVGAFTERTGPESENSGNGKAKEVTEEDERKERSSEGAATSSSVATQDDDRKLSPLDDQEEGDKSEVGESQEGARLKQDESDVEGEYGHDQGGDDDDDGVKEEEEEDDEDASDSSETPPQVRARREKKRTYNRIREARLRQERKEKVAKLESDIENELKEQQVLLEANHAMKSNVTSCFQQNVSTLLGGIVPTASGDSSVQNASSHFSLRTDQANASASSQHTTGARADRLQQDTQQAQSRRLLAANEFSRNVNPGVPQEQVPLGLPPSGSSTVQNGATNTDSSGILNNILVNFPDGSSSTLSNFVMNSLQATASTAQPQYHPQAWTSQVLQDAERTTGSTEQQNVAQPQQQQQSLAIQQAAFQLPRQRGIRQSNMTAQLPIQNPTLEQPSQQHPQVQSQPNQIQNLQQPQPQHSMDSSNAVYNLVLQAVREGNLDLNDPNTLELVRCLLAAASEQRSQQT